ncbi:endonuclease/exonuclease/phosphatase family protein [Plectosphaerella cucumerina]|uniref:Endonuclease/exonuclease/phosphatase family protein n=1 Tax=Plectosphaerella cucumerina TaxID=40658 RepID=A0A8K0X3Y2_9PEZI|nr:endonuclease/exonuclease/phosphatase family protein [Plectosphaerella cucumerina]
MRPSSLLSPLGLFFAAPAVLAQTSQAPLTGDALDLRLVTFNIRYDTSAREPGEKPWWESGCGSDPAGCRMPHVVDQLRHIIDAAPAGAPTLVGLQEALANQITDVVINLGDSWQYIGDGRDGGSRGEHCPILYDANAVEVLHERTRWLSDTPETVSKYRGIGQPRVVTIGVFRDLASGERFIHANTHLDAWNANARAAQIQIALTQISIVQASFGPLPVSLSGDFNTQPGNDAHLVMLESGIMRELWDLTESNRRAGPTDGTWTTFSPGYPAERLDYIWLGIDGRSPWEARQYEIVDNVIDGVFISDHRAVVGDVRLSTGA